MIVQHKPLGDLVVEETSLQFLKEVDANQVSLDAWKTEDYTNCFVEWLTSSNRNTIVGLKQYPHRAYSVGTMDSIQSFIHRHSRGRRIRYSQAEFVASKIISNHAHAVHATLESGPIEPGDAVVISLPFSGTGNEPEHFDLLMLDCARHNVPVLVDIAYYGISHGLIFNMTHPCITDITVSLSKPFVTQLRLGLRLTREFHDDLLQSCSDLKIYNRVSASVGIKLMNHFSHDWIVDKYLYHQKEICQQLNLAPSNTLTLAIGNSGDHQQFYRNGFYRVCITDELQQAV